MKVTVVTLLDMDKTDGGPADLLSFYLFDRIFYLKTFLHSSIYCILFYFKHE